jgi:CheY-like chemotaxis protein
MAKKILLAEDSITMQKIVQMTFAAEDFVITAVSSGEEAIQQAREAKPDLLIADLSMEGKGGYDLCAAVKADPDLADLPVLLLHGNAAPLDPVKAKSSKADGDIAKPFETQALIDKAKELTAATPVAAKEVRRVQALAPPIEDIVIDTASLGAPAKPAEPPKPAVPPRPVAPAAKPAPPEPAKPAAPPARIAAAPKPAVAAPKPPAAPARPAIPPAKPAVPARPPAPSRAATPARPVPAVAAAPAQEMEICIEAEPPPPKEVVGPSFESTFDQGPIVPAVRTPVAPAKPELPPPPPGMPLPGLKPAVKPGEPYEPGAYDAIATLSREVIERIVWEVVPDLAERIIREELDRLVEKRRSG